MHLKMFSKKNEVTTLKDEDIQICKFRRCLQGIRENVWGRNAPKRIERRLQWIDG